MGAKKAGSPDKIILECKRLNIEAKIMKLSLLTHQVVSSSAVRQALTEGDILKVNAMLGTPYTYTSKVERGAGQGRLHAVATLNQHIVSDHCVPKVGVYKTQVEYAGLRYKSLTNIGFSPSLATTSQPTIETHILDKELNVYGHEVKTIFLERIRDEVKFATPADLKEQIIKDMAVWQRA